MKLVCVSDTHTKHNDILLPEGNILIHAGDFSYRGGESEVNDFLNWFEKQDFEHKILICGNHEVGLEGEEDDFGIECSNRGITFLNNTSTTINGVKFYGSPATPWFGGWAYNYQRGDDIKQIWDMIPDDVEVLITHGPVYGILDLVRTFGSPNYGEHVGCQDLFNKLMEIKPIAHISGHIHEGYGKAEYKDIQFYNVSQLNERYKLVNKPITFEIR